MRNHIAKLVVLAVSLAATLNLIAANPAPVLLNEPIDVSGDFRDFANTYYVADRLAAFDPTNQSGKITYLRFEYFTRQAFDNIIAGPKAVEPNEFPGKVYEARRTLLFTFEFDYQRTARLRIS